MLVTDALVCRGPCVGPALWCALVCHWPCVGPTLLWCGPYMGSATLMVSVVSPAWARSSWGVGLTWAPHHWFLFLIIY